MSLNEDIRKTLTDPTPLYFAAGVIDKIREEAPGAFAAVRSTDPKEVQAKVTDRAKDTQVRMNKALGELDADIKKLREQTQSLALQGLGYAAEYAVKAREAYGELAERGRGAVQTWRGESGDAPEITVERQSVRVAEPPQQGRTSTAKNGRGAGSAGGAGGTGGGASGTARSTTARSTSAKSAAPKTAAEKSAAEKNAAQKSTSGQKSSTPKGAAGQKSTAAKKAAGGSAAPKSDS